jgi:hypothetical protein
MSVTDPLETPVEERGAILPMMAILMIVLMGAAAMAVDLGWLFWNSIEIQHGADAAALGGVVYEPDDPFAAHIEATAAARENGYDDLAAETTVAVVDFFDDSSAVLNESMLRVTITEAVPTFFMTLFGIDNIDISRTAVAEFVQPLALGSPESYFGEDPARGNFPGFWGQINGSYVAKDGGDRFGAQCLDGGFGSGCDPNPEARPVSGWGTQSARGGYLYGIEVKEGSHIGLQVEIFNGPVYAIRKWMGDPNSPPNPPDGIYPNPPLDVWGEEISGNFAGDTKYNPSKRNVTARTWFMLYGPDLTPLDTTDGNKLLCSVAYDERIGTAPANDADKPPLSDAYQSDFGLAGKVPLGWNNDWLEFDQVSPAVLNAMWDTMGSSTIADVENCLGSFDEGWGTYVLRVFNEQDPAGPPHWQGANKYSLRVSSLGPDQPAIYGIGDMVMSAARDTTRSDFHLARVEQRYAGKDLIIELWDVGDIVGGFPPEDNATFKIVDGTGATVNCDWVATSTTAPSNATVGSGACDINASDRRFNNELITMTIHIPDDYTCLGNDCWWKIDYTIAGQVHETTTWTAYIDGAPVRIVE